VRLFLTEADMMKSLLRGRWLTGVLAGRELRGGQGAGALTGGQSHDADGGPLNLGTLALTAGGQYFTASASLHPNDGDVPTPGQSPNSTFNGITVVDTQSGDLPWTVSELASNLSDGVGNPGGTISGEHVGLTSVLVPGNAIVTGDVNTDYQTAATSPVGPTDTGSAGLGGGTPHTIATDTAQPDGTVGINGTVTLNAPSSTEASVFTGTITFTVAS
jgi:hypothetical protein